MQLIDLYIIIFLEFSGLKLKTAESRMILKYLQAMYMYYHRVLD